MQIRPLAAELSCGQTDMMKLIVSFLNFRERTPKTYIPTLYLLLLLANLL